MKFKSVIDLEENKLSKVKVVVLDIMGGALDWLNQFGNEDHMELCEIVTLDDKSPIPIEELPQYVGYDYLLVFENGVREYTDKLIDELGISRDRVIYPLDFKNCNTVSSYIFKGVIRDLLKYYSYRSDGNKFAMCQIEGLTYINVASDDIIMPNMIFDGSNWACDEMKRFCDLSNKFFTFNNKQCIFCDIGANIGTTSIYFKKHLDTNVKILAFEPSDQNYRLLHANVLLNNLSEEDYILVKKGLSDKTSTAFFKYKPDNPGASSISSQTDNSGDIVELTTLDNFFETKEIDPETIKYMWIDVEGFEARFLAGAREILKQVNIPVLMEFIPMFYSKKEGEFELLMKELKENFSKYICIQRSDLGEREIDTLWEEKDHLETQWDLFLLK